MSFFMKGEIQACELAKDDLNQIRAFSHQQTQKAKREAGLLIASPQGLLTCFSAGALKGLTNRKSTKQFETSFKQVVKILLKLGL